MNQAWLDGAGRRIRVRIAEFKVAKGNAVLVAIGLGSCIGVAIYDPEHRVGGMAHILLPGKGGENDNPNKFSESSIDAMISQIYDLGGSLISLKAKIVGGANMFSWIGDGKKTIGERNIEAARDKLKRSNIPIEAEEIGGNEGRSVEFHVGSGQLLIRNARGEEHTI